MGWLGGWLGGGTSGGGGSSVNPYTSVATTAESIRDRIIAVIEALTPNHLQDIPYRAWRNEGQANFRAGANAGPAAAFRWFQVRDVGTDGPPEVSNTDVEYRTVIFEILVAYPQTHRYGEDNALDRDDIMSEDQHQIEQAVGLSGYGNFTGSNPHATWREGETEREVGAGCDFLVIRQTMSFYRAMP